MIRIYEYGRVDMDTLLARRDNAADVRETVAAIIDDVRRNGDRALYAYAEKFDHASLTSLEVTPREMEEALALTEPAFMVVLERAAANIRRFHEQQKLSGFILNDRPGVVMGQKILPVERAGIYVPGGKAPLSSTVLMDAIPAKLAGVPKVVMVTPPGKDGKVNPVILAAARVAIFGIGGVGSYTAEALARSGIGALDLIDNDKVCLTNLI